MLIMDWMTSLFNWLPWIGATGIAGYIALALLAPSVLQVASAWLVSLSPLIKGLSEGLVDLTRRMWDGIQDVADNFNTVLFVLVAIASGYFFGMVGDKDVACKDGKQVTCEDCIDKFRVDYKFIKRTAAEREAYLRRVGRKPEPSLFDWF